MNLILFEEQEIHHPLARNDPRAEHLLGILRRKEGDEFDAGVVNGCMGKGKLVAIGKDRVLLSFHWTSPAEPPAPIHLVVGLPRPQTARKILTEATSLGAARISFVHCEKGEASYAASRLWQNNDYRRFLLSGAEQSFTTNIPDVVIEPSLDSFLSRRRPGPGIVLDNYEAPGPLSRFRWRKTDQLLLAIGPERGWSSTERDLFRRNRMHFYHLGRRVLRIETACIAALALVLAKAGLFQ